MPNTREKLIELLEQQDDVCVKGKSCSECDYETVYKCYIYAKADHLIANGVTIPVRCKDCKHFTEGMAVGMCKRIPDKPIIPVVYNHFCSCGERRNDG